MKTVTIYLSDEQYQELKKLAETHKMSMSKIIRLSVFNTDTVRAWTRRTTQRYVSQE